MLHSNEPSDFLLVLRPPELDGLELESWERPCVIIVLRPPELDGLELESWERPCVIICWRPAILAQLYVMYLNGFRIVQPYFE